MPKATEPLYFVVDEKMNSADLTDKGTDWLAKQVNDKELFVLPDITTEMSELEARTDLTDQERLDKKDEDAGSRWCTERTCSHLAAAPEGLHHVQ